MVFYANKPGNNKEHKGLKIIYISQTHLKKIYLGLCSCSIVNGTKRLVCKIANINIRVLAQVHQTLSIAFSTTYNFVDTNKAQQPALYIRCNCVICSISHLTDWSTMGMRDCRSFATLNLTFGTLQRYARHVKTKMFS